MYEKNLQTCRLSVNLSLHLTFFFLEYLGLEKKIEGLRTETPGTSRVERVNAYLKDYFLALQRALSNRKVFLVKVPKALSIQFMKFIHVVVRVICPH